MLTDFKSKPTEEKKGEHNLMDDYLLIMQHLDSTRRFKKFFDPLRLKVYLIQPSQAVVEHEVATAESRDNHFFQGCRAYLKSDFETAAKMFQKVVSVDQPYWYECQFNLATSKFKVGDYVAAHTIYSKLMKEMIHGRLPFTGRDRRLYFNKAICELQMGKFDDCLRTCKNYRAPIKELMAKNSQQVSRDTSDNRLRLNLTNIKQEKAQNDSFQQVIDKNEKLYNLTSFRKLRRTVEQESLTRPIIQENRSILDHFNALHPVYSQEENDNFQQEIYRLKGFAYLRKQEYLSQDSSGKYKDIAFSHQCLVKAATNFQKAIGSDGASIQKLIAQIKKKRQKRLQLQDEVIHMTKLRVTFINFRRKLEGNLAEDNVDENQDRSDSSVDTEYSSWSRASHKSFASAVSKYSAATKAQKAVMKQEKEQLLKQKKRALNYEDLAAAILGQRDKQRKKMQKMMNQNIRLNENQLFVPSAKETLSVPGKSGSRTSFHRKVIQLSGKIVDATQKSNDSELQEKRKSIGLQPMQTAETQRVNRNQRLLSTDQADSDQSSTQKKIKSADKKLEDFSAGPPAHTNSANLSENNSTLKEQVSKVLYPSSAEKVKPTVVRLPEFKIESKEPEIKTEVAPAEMTELEKHKKFLDRFEQEGRQITQELKAPRRQIFTNSKLMKTSNQPLIRKSSTLQSMQIQNSVNKNTDSQLKRMATQSTLLADQISNPLLTSSKSLRSQVIVPDSAKTELVHWTEPFETQKLRIELRKKQHFSYRPQIHVFDQQKPEFITFKTGRTSKQNGLPRVQSLNEISLNDKVKHSIQHAKNLSENTITVKQMSSTVKVDGQVLTRSTSHSDKKLNDAFQSYFIRTIPKNSRLPKSRQTTQLKLGMVVQSMPCGTLPGFDEKFTTEEQRKMDEIEDQTRQIKVLNEVERQMQLTQSQLTMNAHDMASMNAKDRLEANRQIRDDLMYNSKVQETVIKEIQEYEQNRQTKTVTLDTILKAQEEISKAELDSTTFDDGPQPMENQIISRLNNEQLAATIRGETQYLQKLRFFMQYPLKVRQQLIAIGTLEHEEWQEKGKKIFEQGGHYEYYYVIVKGTVQIEQVPARFAGIKNMPAIVKRTCYDGDQFGELTQFKRNVSEFINEVQNDEQDKKHALKNLKKRRDSDFSASDSEVEITDKMTKDLTDHQLSMLNANHDTATTIEPCVLLRINKNQSMAIINETLKSDFFVEKVRFLWKIDLFKGINKNQMLPLISNITVKKFYKGQYVQREGQEPEGLIIIRKGHCIVCTEKLSMRHVAKKHLVNNDNDEAQQAFWQSNPKEMREGNKNRVFQNKLEHIDDEGRPIRRDMLIYKDMLPFENLQPGCYFGGRALLAINNLKNIKKQIQRQENMIGNLGVFDIMKKNLLKKVNNEIEQQIDSKRGFHRGHSSSDIKQHAQIDITSMLSIVANSAKVEVWIIDEDILNLLPVHARNTVLARLKRKQKVWFKKDKKGANLEAKEQLLQNIENQKKQHMLQIKNQIKYSLTGNIVRKRMEGGFRDTPKYLDELERILKQDIDPFPVPKVDLIGGPGEVRRFEKEKTIYPMPVKSVNQDVHVASICPCTACRFMKRVEITTFDEPTTQKVVNIDLMQKTKDNLANKQLRNADNDDVEYRTNAEKKALPQEPLQEDYGEPDRPGPSWLVHDLKKKFVEWDLYKMSVLKDIRRKNHKLKFRD